MENGTRGCLTYGCTMDNEILHELFEHFEKAADVLNEKDFDFRKKAQDCTAKIPPIQIGKHGQIMEWIRDYEEFEPGHRHISHLWALHPAHQITPDKTPELCKAAEVTLKRRLAGGGGHTGWSRAWIMNMYARLWNGNACYDNLLALFQKSTLPNLLDNHPPFQIDGNFGAIAAMAEMLLQSREDCTILLPALPDAWPDGAVYGLCSLDGVRYDLCWRNGLLETATLHAMRETTVTLVYKTNAKKISLSKGENYAETFQE
jgi:alpha-L-fucosidase 2